MNTFGLNLVFIGDFETLKYVYNHPDVQDRLTGLGLEEPVREEKRVKGKLIPGIYILCFGLSCKNKIFYKVLFQVREKHGKSKEGFLFINSKIWDLARSTWNRSSWRKCKK